MQYNTIDAETFSQMFLAGAKRLEAKKEYINELNVFPVPDGDTGTNMTLTIMSAVREVENLTETNMVTVSKAVSSGSLRGARGNSGVILSQLLRGFTKVVKEYEDIDMNTMAMAAQKATETAYKAVMKPKEGTILTVAKAVSDKAVDMSHKAQSMSEFLGAVVEHAQEILNKTPEMLPVLKEAGVVDSGGQGLLELLKGAYAQFNGEDYLEGCEAVAKEEDDENVIYCSEVMISTSEPTSANEENNIYNKLSAEGTDVAVACDENSIKVHVHSSDPGQIISILVPYGVLEVVRVNKLHDEHRTKLFTENELAELIQKRSENNVKSEDMPSEPETPKEETAAEVKESAGPKEYSKKMGFISVSAGEGMDAIFRGLGVDCIISGGQTMNPSTDDMLKAVDQVDAETVFILPNNKNIILAANQTTYLVEDKQVVVIPTKTAPQGITALINYNTDMSAEDNEKLMNEEISKVKTGQVTYAVRDTSINGHEIHQGNIMGIGDHDILSVGEDIETTSLEMIDCMIDEESELISIYYGAEVDEEDAGDFAAAVEAKYPDCDVELHSGGQPIYYYIVSVE